ncbi:MAG: thioredoxin domain-containing protein [Saprospiraceae bacterium]|nr:thioredoxin domain-containing protein [Saprospiraceae bacterium]MBK7736591.1 thioredoxin domain-containing protein [Saprospiraceae bacterium]MBK7912045.1 thioredoxin domain-containing protein [Saprospiraceae bacterium]
MNPFQFETSPYLKQHKDHPVDWHAWSAETLAKALHEQKPILVSIGYSTCHWCHVMAHESFEDPLIATLMNDYFVNIKIDREERPDLDNYFMNAIQAMGISGGWPLNCFLTPDAKPFYGGTYFPPSPNFGRPSWKQILISVHEAFIQKNNEITQQANELSKHLIRLSTAGQKVSTDNQGIDYPKLISQLTGYFDLNQGGFGNQPKFPHASLIRLLFQLGILKKENRLIQHGVLSLKAMSAGGIYDQLEGGFCRYSVDGQWDVPHFEKMLYDHAQLIQALAEACRITNDGFLKQRTRQSIQFFEQYMQDASGLFYAAMDADSEGHEGTYYVWTKSQLQDILEDKYASFVASYGLSNLDHHHTDLKVLRIRPGISDSEELMKIIEDQAACLNTLKAARSLRIKPDIDTKLIISWNAMLASAYCAWYLAEANELDLTTAQKIVDQILDKGFKEDQILCRYLFNNQRVGNGFLEDYAWFIKALLDVYSLTGRSDLVRKAEQLMDFVLVHFKEESSCLLKSTAYFHEDALHSITDWGESNYPNPNAVLIYCGNYLNEATSTLKYQSFIEGMLEHMESISLQHPIAMGGWLEALVSYKESVPVIKTHSIQKVIPMLQSWFIPGLLLIPNSSESGFQLCDQGVCFSTVDLPEKLVPLLSKYS